MRNVQARTTPQTPPAVAPAPAVVTPGTPGVRARVDRVDNDDALGDQLRAAVADRADHAQRSLARSPLGHAGPGLIQRTPETDMIADPEGFLATRMVSLDYAEGMRLRAPELVMDREAFIEGLGTFTQHWFALVPNAARTKEGRLAYVLAPAIERYVQAFPENPLVSALVANPRLPAVGAETGYLRAAYVPYLTKMARDPETDVGHVDVRIERSDEEFSPDFVFTAAMNGCAFTVTGSADEDNFTAWHYQSPGSNRPLASSFRREQSPTDWFGAEEYDSGDHAGLYEVTNLMWRPAAGDWRILSQEVDVSATDKSDASITQMRSRPLVLAGGAALGYTRRIYRAFPQTQLEEMQESIDSVRQRHVTSEETALYTRLATAVRVHLAGEIARLDAAGDFAALSDAAAAAKAARGDAIEIRMLAGTIGKLADQREQADLKKFKFRQNVDLQRTLAARANNMANVLKLFANTKWLDELAAEARARVPVVEAAPAPLAVADGAAVEGAVAVPVAS